MQPNGAPAAYAAPVYVAPAAYPPSPIDQPHVASPFVAQPHAAPLQPAAPPAAGGWNYGAAEDRRPANTEIAALFGSSTSRQQSGFSGTFGFGATAFDTRETRDSRGRRDEAIDKAFDLAAINPLVSAASPLLWLAGRLIETAQPDDVAEFRRRVVEEIRQFETAAMAKNIPERLVRVARYALCATIDDIVLNTSWGAASGWASSSLVGILYNETWGGERFYDLLAQLQQQPEQTIDALELMAIALAIGFAGKYRVTEGGQSQHTRLRHDLYRIIRRVRGPYEKKMSTTWVGIPAPYRAPVSLTAPWVAAALVLLLLAGLWAFASISLRGRVEDAADKVRALVPQIPVVVERAGIPQIPDPVPPVRQTQIERIRTFLAQEIASRQVEVVPSGNRIIVRMLGASFPSGGTAIAPTEEPLIAKIGAAFNDEPGPILVTGHTDNIPVGPGSPLGDNIAISTARARSTADLLKRHVSEPTRVTFEGRGQNDPIDSNQTAEGRARNRRVDFSIPQEEAR